MFKLKVICSSNYTINNGDTCESIILANRIRSTRFYQINPDIDCEHLITGRLVCLNDGHSKCIRYIKVNEFQPKDCQSLANSIGINLITFTAINAAIDCSQSINASYVCAEALNPECENLYKVVEGDSISNIMNANILTENEFYRANPYAYEDGIQTNQVICLKLVSTESSSFNAFVNSYGNLAASNSKLQEALDYYLSNPSQNNEKVLQETYISEIESK